MRKFGLIGYPLEHSFSPSYFKEKFFRENIRDTTYDIFPIPSIEDLHQLLHDQPEVLGFNVTIPYKQQILPYLNSSVGIPAGLNACNCIKMVEGRLIGYNTDIIGFENSLRPLLHPHHTQCLVLGNGGATQAIVYVLKKMGIEYKIVSRSLHENSVLTYEDLTDEIIRSHPLIIHTTPVGMYPQMNDSIKLPFKAITPQHLCYDLIYNPEETKFLSYCKQQGATVKNGLEMLTIQAEESWKIWNP